MILRLPVVVGVVWFAAFVVAHAQPEMVLDINPGPAGLPLPLGQVRDEQLFFQALHPDSGTEIWVSDGTAANTVLAAEFIPGPTGSGARVLGIDKGLVYVSAANANGNLELWSISSPAFPATAYQGITSPNWLGNVGGRLLVSATSPTVQNEVFWADAVGGPQLWVDVNGSSLTSAPCCLIPTGPNSALLSARASSDPIISSAPHWLIEDSATEIRSSAGNKVSPRGVFRPVENGYFFFGTEDAGFDSLGTEPWLIDFLGSQATLIDDLNPGGESSGALAYPISLTYKGEVYFAADTPGRGLEVWKSNGVGAQLVGDFAPGEDGSDPIAFLEYREELYFGVRTRGGPQLWKTDGASTTLVASLGSNPNFEAPWPVAVVDGHLLFRVETEAHGQELWVTNGRAGRVAMVSDINPGAADGIGRPIAWEINPSRLLFVADDGVHGPELWRLGAGYLDSLLPLFADSFECDSPLCP
ncbi:MAG: hypothetical protein AAF358_03305 [Pseudomonadota bacterium]